MTNTVTAVFSTISGQATSTYDGCVAIAIVMLGIGIALGYVNKWFLHRRKAG